MSKIFKYLAIIFFFSGVYSFYKTRMAEIEKENESLYGNLSSSENEMSGDVCETNITGVYYVNDSLSRGVSIYKDVLKKRKYKQKLFAMDEVSIEKVENDLGYSAQRFDRGEGGWVEMRNLICEKRMFPVSEKGKYLVRSTEINGINLYKDQNKRKSYRTKLKPLTDLDVYKKKGGMAYVKNIFVSGSGYVNGWVEFEKLEKK